jgi:hypothetical protein
MNCRKNLLLATTLFIMPCMGMDRVQQPELEYTSGKEFSKQYGWTMFGVLQKCVATPLPAIPAMLSGVRDQYITHLNKKCRKENLELSDQLIVELVDGLVLKSKIKYATLDIGLLLHKDTFFTVEQWHTLQDAGIAFEITKWLNKPIYQQYTRCDCNSNNFSDDDRLICVNPSNTPQNFMFATCMQVYPSVGVLKNETTTVLETPGLPATYMPVCVTTKVVSGQAVECQEAIKLDVFRVDCTSGDQNPYTTWMQTIELAPEGQCGNGELSCKGVHERLDPNWTLWVEKFMDHNTISCEHYILVDRPSGLQKQLGTLICYMIQKSRQLLKNNSGQPHSKVQFRDAEVVEMYAPVLKLAAVYSCNDYARLTEYAEQRTGGIDYQTLVFLQHMGDRFPEPSVFERIEQHVQRMLLSRQELVSKKRGPFECIIS